MEKKIKIIGDIEVGGERGLVVFKGGVAKALSATEYKDPQKTIKHLTEIRPKNMIPEEKRREEKRREEKRREEKRRDSMSWR